LSPCPAPMKPIVPDTAIHWMIHIDTQDPIPYISRNEKQLLSGFAASGGRKEFRCLKEVQIAATV
jgi:hypothetical protein